MIGNNHSLIPGLTYLPNFISKEEESKIIESILEKQWNTSLKRRTQHYGYAYSYQKKNSLNKAQQIPESLHEIKLMVEKEISSQQEPYVFDQLIVNEYEPGQGITPHIDNVSLFDAIVVSLSLGSDVVMVFQKLNPGNQIKQILLERRSLVILDRDARYKWKHSIPSRKKDQGVARNIRYSLTFRKVLNKIQENQPQEPEEPEEIHQQKQGVNSKTNQKSQKLKRPLNE